MKTLSKILLIFILLVSYNISFAQEAEAEPKFELSGSADAYFRANLGGPTDQAPATSFANLPGFSLGMFNLIGSYEGEKAGVVGDLVFGPRGVDAVFASGAPTNIVNQLYVYYNASDAVTFTLGNFNTFLGYEVISPAANFNYSTSYMFSYGPFSHTGLKADIALGDDASLMLGVFNPTDFTEFNPFGSYSFGAQLGFKGVYLNLLYGDQDGTLDEGDIDGTTSAGALFQVDLTAGFDVTDALYVGVNATYNATAAGEEVKGTAIGDIDGDASSFYGAAAYLQYRTSDAFAIGVRGEYFGEGNGGYGIIGGYDSDFNASIIELTVSGNINIGSLTLIPEIRLDSASEEVFADGDDAPTGTLASFVLAGVYSF